MTLYLWDASDYDWARGPMDLAAAKRDGMVGFTHKATEGTSVRHRHTGEALNRARDAGLEFIGAYHVVRTGNVAGQVAYFLAYLDEAVPWWRTFPGFVLQVDLELWDYDKVSAATGAAFVAELRRQAPGRCVVLYASRGQYGAQLAGVAVPLWNAAYGANPAVHYPDAYPGDLSLKWAPYSGQAPAFWQYGSRLTIGTQPMCDASAFRGSLEQLRELITGAPPFIPTPPASRRHDMPGLFKTAASDTVWSSDGFRRKALTAAMYADFVEAWPGQPIAVCVDDAALEAVAGPVWAETSVEVTLSPAGLAQVSGAAHDGAASAIDGATVSGATITAAP